MTIIIVMLRTKNVIYYIYNNNEIAIIEKIKTK